MLDTRDKVGALVLAAISFGPLTSCGPISAGGGRTEVKAPGLVTELGEGIYQFPAKGWPGSLVDFQKEHPDLQIVDTETATSTGHGDPTSFVVITAPKILESR